VSRESPAAILAHLSNQHCGVFRIEDANAARVTANQVHWLQSTGVVERVLPNTYRLLAVPRSDEQDLHVALLWAGDRAAVAGRSAAARYRLQGVHASKPEIVVPQGTRARTTFATVYNGERRALMIRMVNGLPTTGVEATLLRLAHELDEEAFEIACEDARRRRLTSVSALRRYLERHAKRGRVGVAALRRALDELDPEHPARSVLEVRARRLLVARGLDDFVREFPLTWNGRTYRYDFAFPARRVILETNGRRWHDDTTDYEHDNEKWSVPGRCGYRIVFATWGKVDRRPDELVDELRAAMT
jgi:predicted transcriptional regulator of viral defense system/very-short-patch-repair endonuclease